MHVKFFYFENLFPVSYRRKEHSIGIDLSCQVVCITLDGVHCYQFINILCARPQRLRKAILATNCMFQKVHLSLFTINSMLFRYCSQSKVVRSRFPLNLK